MKLSIVLISLTLGAAHLNAMEVSDIEASVNQNPTGFTDLPNDMQKELLTHMVPAAVDQAPTLMQLFKRLGELHCIHPMFSKNYTAIPLEEKKFTEVFDKHIPWLLYTLNTRRDVHSILFDLVKKMKNREKPLNAEKSTVKVLNIPRTMQQWFMEDTIFQDLLVPAFLDNCPRITRLAGRFTNDGDFARAFLNDDFVNSLRNPDNLALLQEVSDDLLGLTGHLTRLYAANANIELPKNEIKQEFALEKCYEKTLREGAAEVIPLGLLGRIRTEPNLCKNIAQVLAAAEEGDLQKINFLLAEHFANKRTASVIDTAILFAALQGHTKLVEELLSLQPSPIIITTLLCHAALEDNKDLAKVILPAFKLSSAREKICIMTAGQFSLATPIVLDEFWKEFFREMYRSTEYPNSRWFIDFIAACEAGAIGDIKMLAAQHLNYFGACNIIPTLLALRIGNVQAFQETVTLSVQALEKQNPILGKGLMKYIARMAMDYNQNEMFSLARDAEDKLDSSF